MLIIIHKEEQLKVDSLNTTQTALEIILQLLETIISITLEEAQVRVVHQAEAEAFRRPLEAVVHLVVAEDLAAAAVEAEEVNLFV